MKQSRVIRPFSGFRIIPAGTMTPQTSIPAVIEDARRAQIERERGDELWELTDKRRIDAYKATGKE